MNFLRSLGVPCRSTWTTVDSLVRVQRRHRSTESGQPTGSGLEDWIKRQGEVTKTVISIGVGFLGVAWYVHREVRESGAVLESRFNQQLANTEQRLERKVADSEQRLERRIGEVKTELKDDLRSLAKDVTDIKLMFMAQQQRFQQPVIRDNDKLAVANNKM